MYDPVDICSKCSTLTFILNNRLSFVKTIILNVRPWQGCFLLIKFFLLISFNINKIFNFLNTQWSTIYLLHCYYVKKKV